MATAIIQNMKVNVKDLVKGFISSYDIINHRCKIQKTISSKEYFAEWYVG